MSKSSEHMRISKELAEEIRKKKRKYKEMGVEKSLTDCSKDLVVDLNTKRRDSLW